MKIWFDKHAQYFGSLENFEQDDVAGFDMIESPETRDEDDTSWLFPPKGPGEFKKLKNKKKKKSKKVKKTEL
jgi:hypothetical protein